MQLLRELLKQSTLTEEDADPESASDFPKIIAKAAEFKVELNEGEQVRLLKNDSPIATMPLVIWKQLTR